MSKTPIPGLLVVDLPIHRDSRGWFKENWQREKMVAAGLPDFRPVQNNVSFNDVAGTTRGIHAEPWDKYVSVVTGRIFGAWVDLREGESFGAVFTTEVDKSRAVFVPRGVGNAFQTLETATAYVDLVNDHYTHDAEYVAVNAADARLCISWPIALDIAEMSARDRALPSFEDIKPISPRKTMVLGAEGQLGRALQALYGSRHDVEFLARAELDLSIPTMLEAQNWRDYDTIINAAAYTAVDAAETPDGRVSAWAANVSGVAALARAATAHGITLIHISSDYVFDGSASRPYREDDLLSPLGVYGQTKAAGEQLVSATPKHYIVRTSWVIGDGKNFVRTMLNLAARGASPSVVDDQQGRLTFASELARAIQHLVSALPPYGVYNVTSPGKPTSWAAVAKRVFALAGHDPDRVRDVSTQTYNASTGRLAAARPANSLLDLTKMCSTGFVFNNADDLLRKYIEKWRLYESA